MGRSSPRRWPRRLLAMAMVAGVAATVREAKLRENAERFGLPR